MGTTQSSRANSNNDVTHSMGKSVPESTRGRKSITTSEAPHAGKGEIASAEAYMSLIHELANIIADDNDVADDLSESGSDEDDAAVEEGLEERKRILEDARNLKAYAQFYSRPDLPVVTTDPFACARNYFSRASADEQIAMEDAEEKALILQDVLAMKKENALYRGGAPVAVDPLATCRCYFDRPSAPSPLSMEDAEEQARILEDARNLKKQARAFLHPEDSVEVDQFACARCYFDRPSAPAQPSVEEEEEAAMIAEDILNLKRQARMYMHPEASLEVDPLASARCYFDRPSAPSLLSAKEAFEEAREAKRILEDAKNLKKCATMFMHPENAVETDPLATARCYFDRLSGPEQTSFDEVEEMSKILEDARMLKAQARMFLHPEDRVEAVTASRCYFDRASGPDVIDFEEVEEEAEQAAQILEDARSLKLFARRYLHPEDPVEVDPLSTARCYFDRPSGPVRMSAKAAFDSAREAKKILDDSLRLKALARMYMHPEAPVDVSATATARCYFARPGAPEQVSCEDAQEAVHILEDMNEMKKLARLYRHPEVPLEIDPLLTSRCYFDRASAPAQLSPLEASAEAHERKKILEETQKLKQQARMFMHPEDPVEVDPLASARCYFDRFGAPEQSSNDVDNDSEEQELILEDLKNLKRQARLYHHPEDSVEVDPLSTARCYFDRPSAPEVVSAKEACAVARESRKILEDGRNLAKFARMFMHPEAPVDVNPVAGARCYFDRLGGPECVSKEEADEVARILEDAHSLKVLARMYLHPELPIAVDPVVSARCYFDRASGPRYSKEELEFLEEKRRVLEDAKACKDLYTMYRHPELPVTTTCSSATGRNYFSRASARGHSNMVHTYGADELHEDSEQNQDFFHMDEDLEDMFDDMREELVVPEGPMGKTQALSDDEGNLSRSPSSVMLFQGESAYD